MSITQIKPGHKAIQAYYEAKKVFDSQGATHEGATSTAFQSLLIATGQEKKWALIPQLTLKIDGKNVRPDGTFRDEWHLPRGYWEAKDTGDDLDVEIKKKTAKGYPLSNIIFEDTTTAVLFQNGSEARRISLAEPGKLADLLTDFYRYTTPDYEGFNEAVAAFKERIPDLARGLTEKITVAHKKNKAFIAAFADFLELCKTSLNPNIRVEAVDEMLVQHLLTERLFRTIFQNADFTRRNVIAAEIETVIAALTSTSFSREEFLKSLDTFYLAIEGAAGSIADFSQKQHFLNTVYERFFQGYSVKVADTHGIVYTPQEIVDFMCASVEEVLRTEFGKGLGDEGVTILDPCTGTGNFIVNLMRRIPKRDLPRAYKEQLFANEVMLLPYYIASMNIEHEYYDLTGNYEPFEGLCFVDTLELAEGEQRQLSFMSEKNTERVERQKKTPITVVIGNPPYNVGQINENDNNKNRKYKTIDSRINSTYVKQSRATLLNKLYDPYVKFFRWATDRLKGQNGIVCFVSNNSFLDDMTFDGMRGQFTQEFSKIYHVSLAGKVRLNYKLSGSAYNVFGIQVGVGITIAIRSESHQERTILGAFAEKDWRREKKLLWLQEAVDLRGLKWSAITPDPQNNWLSVEHSEEFQSYLSIGSKEGRSSIIDADTLFRVYSPGVNSSRDSVVYDIDKSVLLKRLNIFLDDYNLECHRYLSKGRPDALDEFLDYSKIKWSRNLKRHLRSGKTFDFDAGRMRRATYRPFVRKFIYYQAGPIDEVGKLYKAFPKRNNGE